MANATVNLPITFTHYVREDQPYTIQKTNNSTEYRIANIKGTSKLYECGLLGKIAKMPNNLRHNVLVGYRYTVVAKNTAPQVQFSALDRIQDYDESSANYNYIENHTHAGLTGFRVEAQTSLQNYTVSQNTYADIAYELLRLGAVYLYSNNYHESGATYSKTVLADGSTKPYISIIYDDAAKIKSKVSYNSSQLTGTISNAVAKTLTWALIRDTSTYASSYCADPTTWNQASAVFKYRKQGESTWLTRNVSGSTKSITIPAGTFQSGASYEYQITVTDEDGTVSSTSVYTFTVAATSVTPSNAPTSGYANPRNPISFGWVYQSTAGGTIASGATTLHWRVSGDETWNDVQAAAGVNSLTIPANTFPTASTIQWYLSGSDSTGYASQTSIYSFSTAAGAVTATATSPSNTIESNNQPITFRWSYSSPDGFAPTRYKFLWKRVTDAEYTELLDETDVVNEYTFPAYTFPAGEIRWGVIPYNIDGVQGSGNSRTFVCYGAPAAPVVSAEAVPFTTVVWQADDQQAYQIKVDDTVYGPYFGTEKSFELPDKLEDGDHTIGVAVIGTYALWSEWGEITVVIENTGTRSIVLATETNVMTSFATYPIHAGVMGRVDLDWSDDRSRAVITGYSERRTQVPLYDTLEAEVPPALELEKEYTIKYTTTNSSIVLAVWINDEELETTSDISIIFHEEDTFRMYLKLPDDTLFDNEVITISIPSEIKPGVDANLIWLTSDETSDFYIFRDGVHIGRTDQRSFSDRFASGTHTYKVMNRFADGNYSESNEVTLDTNIDGTYISLLSGGEWLKIKYMLKSASDQEYEESVETVYTHLAGDRYPSVSISNYHERSLKYSAVFLLTDEADHAKFKSMLKQPVILKFQNGNIIVGVIDSWTVLHRKHYYTAYTFSLRQIEWEDYVDDTT